MMSLWDALRMNMMISYQELVRTFLIIKPLHNRNKITWKSSLNVQTLPAKGKESLIRH